MTDGGDIIADGAELFFPEAIPEIELARKGYHYLTDHPDAAHPDAQHPASPDPWAGHPGDSGSEAHATVGGQVINFNPTITVHVDSQGGTTTSMGGSSDAHGGTTTAAGGASDAHGGASDAHGGAADAHGGASDAHGGAASANPSAAGGSAAGGTAIADPYAGGGSGYGQGGSAASHATAGAAAGNAGGAGHAGHEAGGHGHHGGHGGGHGGSGLLCVGSTGIEVSRWQEQLNLVMGAGLTVDGIFGHMTQQATIHFQAAHGLGADGIVGPHTEQVITQLTSTPAHDEPAPARHEPAHADVAPAHPHEAAYQQPHELTILSGDPGLGYEPDTAGIAYPAYAAPDEPYEV